MVVVVAAAAVAAAAAAASVISIASVAVGVKPGVGSELKSSTSLLVSDFVSAISGNRRSGPLLCLVLLGNQKINK